MRQLERRALKAKVLARRIRQDEAKVDVDDVAGLVDEQVAVCVVHTRSRCG